MASEIPFRVDSIPHDSHLIPQHRPFFFKNMNLAVIEIKGKYFVVSIFHPRRSSLEIHEAAHTANIVQAKAMPKLKMVYVKNFDASKLTFISELDPKAEGNEVVFSTNEYECLMKVGIIERETGIRIKPEALIKALKPYCELMEYFNSL